MEISNEHAMVPRPGPNMYCTSTVFVRAYSTHDPLYDRFLACCTLFTAALASAVAEGDSSDDRDPAGSGKIRGATCKYDSSDIKLGCRLRKKRF